MDEHGGAPVAEDGDDVARLVALTERQHDLWALLRDAQDEQTRNRLFDELSANREELAQLKDKVSAEIETSRARPPNDRPESSPESPRSLGEELRSRILTPNDVAPPSPPPPPPPPPLVIETSGVVEDSRVVQGDAPTLAKEEPARAAPTVERDAPPSVPAPSEPEPIVPPPSEPVGLLPPGGLAPEKTPFSSREADLAATRARHQKARQPPPQPQASPKMESPAPSAAEPVADPVSTPAVSASPESRRSAKEEARLAAAHAALQDLERVRPKHVRSFPVFAILVAIIAVAAVAWVLFFWRSDSPDPSGQGAETITTAPVVGEAAPPAMIRSVLDGLGLSMVAIEERSGTLFLTGVVASDRDRAAAIGATEALAGGVPVDSTGLAVGVTGRSGS